MREDDIRSAIENLPWQVFERFARELLRRELYPGLNPTSESHDLGEDARTEPSVAFLHDGKLVSVLASKTCTWSKIRGDCKRCQETRRQIDIVVFATAGNPRTDTQEPWRESVKEEFGWDLEVRTIDWFAPVASAPQHEKLVDDYLHIPPPDEDFVDTIKKQFSLHTKKALDQIRLLVPGIPNSLHRDEVGRCEDQLQGNKSVTLTGEAGTGKSGIGKKLALPVIEQDSVVLLLDARRVAHIKSEAGLRQHFGLKGPVCSAIGRIGRYRGCRFIVDQLDNVVGSIAAKLLVELMVECHGLEGVEVVAISRKRESHEGELLQPLLSAGFTEVTSYPLNENRAREVLQKMGIAEPTRELVELGRNLLNLEIIGTIREREPRLDFSSITDELDLWEHYRESLLEREDEEVIAEAVRLARDGLIHPERMIELDYPCPQSQRRLISSGVVMCQHGRVYRFSHEKLQDFLYAWDATERCASTSMVINEIGPHRARNVIIWMDKIYARQRSPFRKQFLREVLSVGK
jgi:hypothetical protein